MYLVILKVQNEFSWIENELEHGVSARSIYMIDSDIAINQPYIEKK